MVSEPPNSMDHDANMIVEEPVIRSLSNKKNQGKVPKKIHKAEREKLKRDQLNDLFLALGHALVTEPARQNNGKASILDDATRLLRDLIVKVESLRKENVALVTESHYVTAEKNELKDEKIALEADVARLQVELQERLQSDPMWHDGRTTSALPTLPQATSTPLPVPQPPVAPIYVVPLQQDLRAFQEPLVDPSTTPKPPTQVMRPHARYPTPSDSWPLQLLSGHQHGGSSSSSSNGGDEISNKA